MSTNCWGDLPRYVAEGHDSMPSSRLYERDLVGVMNIMEKMNGRIQDVKLAAILKDINSLRSSSTGAIGIEVGSTAGSQLQPQALNNSDDQPRVNMTSGNPVNSSAYVASAANAAEAASNGQLNWLLATGTDWASVAASSLISTKTHLPYLLMGRPLSILRC